MQSSVKGEFSCACKPFMYTLAWACLLCGPLQCCLRYNRKVCVTFFQRKSNGWRRSPYSGQGSSNQYETQVRNAYTRVFTRRILSYLHTLVKTNSEDTTKDWSGCTNSVWLFVVHCFRVYESMKFKIVKLNNDKRNSTTVKKTAS